MKTNILPVLALIAVSSSGLHAQGSLTPPSGPPGPVMKTLDQVEARTPLVAGQAGVSIDGNGTITIGQPGSYYLTRNLSFSANVNGIVVTSDDVTLDLNGFALTNTAGSGSAVYLTNCSGVTVRNGTIRGGTTVSGSTFTLAGWTHGVYAAGNYANLVAERLTVSGVRDAAIHLGSQGSRVVDCSTHITGWTSIVASSISSTTVRKAGAAGILVSSEPDGGMVLDCIAETVHATFHAITANDGTVSNSRGTAIGGRGIMARIASNSTGVSTSSYGLTAVTADNCFGASTSGTGLFSQTAANCRGQSVSGTYGMEVTGTASFCRGERAGGVALSAGIAIGCTTAAGTISSAQKHLGTP